MTYTRENLTTATTDELDNKLAELYKDATALAEQSADYLASSPRNVPLAHTAAKMRADTLAECREIMAELLRRHDAAKAAQAAETSDL